jgi:hypothetical protein
VTVLEFDRKDNGAMGQLGQQILKKRFESYNKVWIANVIETGAINDQDYFDHEQDRMMTSYEQESNMINSANYFNDKVCFLDFGTLSCLSPQLLIFDCVFRSIALCKIGE